MALTEKQELYISRYLKDVAEALHGHLGPAVQEQAVAHLRLRILEEALKFAGDQPIDDLQRLGVLNQQGPAAERAEVRIRMYLLEAKTGKTAAAQTYAAPHAKPNIPTEKKETKAEEKAAKSSEVPSPSNVVWLGVCQYIARSLSQPLWIIRALTLLAGLVLAPIALLVYSGLFLFLNYSGALPEKKKVSYFRCGGHIFITAFFLVLFHLAGKYGLQGIVLAFEYFLEQSIQLPSLTDWAWLTSRGDTLFFWALILLLPLALVSALPLSKEWALSLKRLTQAGVALYALLIAAGLASRLAGILIEFYSEFTS